MALITVLAAKSYGMIANHATKNINQSSRWTSDNVGLAIEYAKVFVIPCLYGHESPPGLRLSIV
jgi:hypothetical protein